MATVANSELKFRLQLDDNKQTLARPFKSTFRYKNDVLPLNNLRLGHFVDHIYPIELEIKDTADTDTDTDRSASCFDLLLEIDSEG